jgi:hypothetical protein
MDNLQQNIRIALSTLTNQYNSKIRFLLIKYRDFPVVRAELVKQANIEYCQAVESLKNIYQNANTLNNQSNLIQHALHNPIITIDKGKKPILKKALLIGINYRNTDYELYGCINDAYSMEQLLKTKYGYTSTTVITDDTAIKPTSFNIVNLFTNFIKTAVPGQTLFIMYSGHGSYVLDRNKDEQTKNDQMIVGCNLVGVLDDTLKKIITMYLPKGVNLVFMADACFSASILDLRYQYMDTFTNKQVNVNSKQTETPGNLVLISGSQDNQTSADTVINDTPNGALTWAVMKTLNMNNRPTWSNFLKSVRTLLKGNGFSQIAQLSSGRPLNINNRILL